MPCSAAGVAGGAPASSQAQSSAATLTLMEVPAWVNSAAKSTVCMCSAAREELWHRSRYGANSQSGSGCRASGPGPLQTFTIRPAADRLRSGSIAWLTRRGAWTFVSKAALNVADSAWLDGERSRITPAWLINTSSRSSGSPLIQAAAAATLAESVTSSRMKRASTPCAVSRAVARCPLCSSGAPTSTVMPWSLPRRRAISWAVSLFAPLTRATRRAETGGPLMAGIEKAVRADQEDGKRPARNERERKK